MNIKLITTGDPKIDEAFRNLTTIISMQQDKISELETYVNSLRKDIICKLTGSKNVTITSEGGIAIRLKNNTGGESVKGYVVAADASVEGAVKYITQGGLNPIGVFYESGIPNGIDALVVVSGIANVYFSGSVSLGQMARGFVGSDLTAVNGQATSIDYPIDTLNMWQGEVQLTINPETTLVKADMYFYKVGVAIESRSGAGLAKTVLHLN